MHALLKASYVKFISKYVNLYFMRYVWGVFVLFIITSFIITPVHGDMLVKNFDMLTNITLNRTCMPNDTGIIIHSQQHSDGSKIEIVCDSGEYRMKYIKRDGTTVYVGKCAFERGRNAVMKKVTMDILINQSGFYVTNVTLRQTYWVSLNATPVPPVLPGNFTTTNDMLWCSIP